MALLRRMWHACVEFAVNSSTITGITACRNCASNVLCKATRTFIAIVVFHQSRACCPRACYEQPSLPTCRKHTQPSTQARLIGQLVAVTAIVCRSGSARYQQQRATASVQHKCLFSCCTSHLLQYFTARQHSVPGLALLQNNLQLGLVFASSPAQEQLLVSTAGYLI